MSVWMVGKVEAPPKENRIVPKATKQRNISNWNHVDILIVKHLGTLVLSSTPSAFLFLLRELELCQNDSVLYRSLLTKLFSPNLNSVHTTREEFLKRKNHRLFWICLWGKLRQGNHMIIVTPWFSKSSVFNKCFPSIQKRKAAVFKFFRVIQHSRQFSR